MFGFTGTDMQVVVFVAVITIVQAIFNHLGIKVTTFLTDISGYIIFATTAVLVVACLYFAPAIDISRLWTFTNFSGEAGGNVFPQSDNMGYLFLLCLLLPVYTITGYDASAHTSEETKNAAISVPTRHRLGGVLVVADRLDHDLRDHAGHPGHGRRGGPGLGHVLRHDGRDHAGGPEDW